VNIKLRQIEVDSETARMLEARAAERGISVTQLVADLAARDTEPVAAETEQIAELDRRWSAAQSQGETAPHREVVRWLETWGTPTFKPWRER
jgi:predicted transcriptional regulator